MAIGNIQGLTQAAPVNEDRTNVDWSGFEEGIQAGGFKPDAALAASWCSFGEANIEALIDAPQLTVIFPDGVYSSVGKRKMFGKSVKYDMIDYTQRLIQRSRRSVGR